MLRQTFFAVEADSLRDFGGGGPPGLLGATGSCFTALFAVTMVPLDVLGVGGADTSCCSILGSFDGLLFSSDFIFAAAAAATSSSVKVIGGGEFSFLGGNSSKCPSRTVFNGILRSSAGSNL